ncbi:MAG: hypothetical protein ACREIA_05315 [Opitutaceae bacterium]
MIVLGDILRFGRLPDAKQITFINNTTAALVTRHPGFFTGFCGVNPTLGERATVAEIETRAAEGFRGIKLEISNNARDACMRPVMRVTVRINEAMSDAHIEGIGRAILKVARHLAGAQA